MFCRLCNIKENVQFRRHCLMSLCDICSKHTPQKVYRKEFDSIYWGNNSSEISEDIKQNFYEDYKYSALTLMEYILRSNIGNELDEKDLIEIST